MSVSPSRKSLLRLLLGAALVLLGWVLASSTSAHADDRGTVGPVGTVGTVVDGTILERTPEVTGAATAAVGDAARTAVDDAVSTATRPAEKAVERTPAAAPTRAVASTVRVATKSASTTVVAPVVDAAVVAVERTTEQVGSLPGTTLSAVPEVEAPRVPTTDAPAPAPAAVEQCPTQRAADAGARHAARAHGPATGSWVAPLFGATARDGMPARAWVPSGPEPVVPSPASHSAGLAPGSSSGAGQGGPPADGSTPPGGARCPELTSAALSSDAVRPCPGPAADPGSRPG